MMAKTQIQRQFDDPQVAAFSERMRALRLYWGLTQGELADRSGIPRPAMALLETKRNKGSSFRLRERLAQGYGVDVQVINNYIAGDLAPVDVVRESSCPPAPPPIGTEGKPEPSPSRRGRPAGKLMPEAWRDAKFIQLVVRDGMSGPAALLGASDQRPAPSLTEASRRLSYATAEVDEDEWDCFPNLARAVDLVVEHTGASLAAVEHSAQALALASESRTDRSTLEWAQLLERHVLRMRSGSRFNPRSLPALTGAIQRALGKAPLGRVEQAAAEAARAEGDPRLLDESAWLERIVARLGPGPGPVDSPMEAGPGPRSSVHEAGTRVVSVNGAARRSRRASAKQ